MRNSRYITSLKANLHGGNAVWLLLVLLVIVVDQITKTMATTHLVYGQAVPVVPFFNLTLLHNYGAAFSFLSGAGGWQRWFFTGLACAAIGFFTLWLFMLPTKLRILPLAITMVLGGAVGNLIDRVTLGYVVDFISVYYQSYHFPVFNIADSAITLGAILLIVDMLWLEPQRLKG